MKKLNRKGFTLVELLAVIIILAIVVGVTIPAVLSTITSSRKKSGENAAQIAANWIDEQYVLAGVDASGVDDAFKASGACGGAAINCVGKDATISSADFIVAAGMKTSDVASIKVNINATTGKSCVVLNVKSDGGYYITSDGGTQTYTAGASCTGTTGYNKQ